MMKNLKNIFTIRFKLLFMSSFLLVIPWLGFQYILEMEKYLQQGQEQTVLGTAQALALSLSERPELFRDNSVSSGLDLYVYPVRYSLEVDDNSLRDWRDYQQYEQHYEEFSSTPNPHNQFSSFRNIPGVSVIEGDLLSYRLMLAEHDNFLYIYIRVLDEHVIFRGADDLRIDKSDSIRLSMLNQGNVFEQYVIAPYEYGSIRSYHSSDDVGDVSALEYEPAITGRWSEIAEGYEVELRLPIAMAEKKLGLGIYDIDDIQSRRINAIVSTSNLDDENSLGLLRRPLPVMERILSGLGRSNSRVQVVDRSQQVLLSIGDITTATGLSLSGATINPENTGMWSRFRGAFLHPMYERILGGSRGNYVDALYQGGALEGDHIISALTGQPLSHFRTLSDNESRILQAAYPISSNNQILGAVVVDQNMDGIRTFRNQAMESLFDTLLGILILTIAALFIFASSLSSRIRVLRNQAENTLDDSGRIRNTIVASRSSDEIGDLSRSFSNTLDRLGQYTHYLENMSSRLSHELRTPVIIVRSSLENLRLVSQDKDADVYIQRAEEGITRLNLILNNMSEAARLEQILQTSDKARMDLTKVIEVCMQSYGQIYANINFAVELQEEPVYVIGNADYIVQLMDKLIANAVEFSYPDKDIRVSCSSANGEASISVINNGPYLSDSMKDRIFDSMVSLRPEGQHKQPHLGMGLHIARMIAEFHGGYIYADNLIEEQGVMVVLRIPLQ